MWWCCCCFFWPSVECFHSIFESCWCEVCAQGFLSHIGQISANAYFINANNSRLVIALSENTMNISESFKQKLTILV